MGWYDVELITGNKIQNAKTPTADREGIDVESVRAFADACKTGKQYPGTFAESEYLTEAVNLYAAALRSNRLLKYDASKMLVTNVAEANKYLDRSYRKGWEL